MHAHLYAWCCVRLDRGNRQFDGSITVQHAGLSLSLLLYVHSRGIARRREGTAIIYESRKSRSIDLSDRSRSLARTLVRTRSNVVPIVRGNTLTRDTHVYDATITAIAVTLVELYWPNTISRVRHIRIHLLYAYIHCVYLRPRDDVVQVLFFVDRIMLLIRRYLQHFITLYPEK